MFWNWVGMQQTRLMLFYDFVFPEKWIQSASSSNRSIAFVCSIYGLCGFHSLCAECIVDSSQNLFFFLLKCDDNPVALTMHIISLSHSHTNPFQSSKFQSFECDRTHYIITSNTINNRLDAGMEAIKWTKICNRKWELFLFGVFEPQINTNRSYSTVHS